MSNTISDLNGFLFNSLKRLDKEGLEGKDLMHEVQRANAVAKVGQVIATNASLQLKAEQLYQAGKVSIIPKQLEDNSEED